MVEFKISTMIVAFFFFLGFVTVGFAMIEGAFSVEPTSETYIAKQNFNSYYARAISDANTTNTDLDSGLSGELTNTNLGDTLLNKITGGYWGKVLTIKRTFSYISDDFFIMIKNVFSEIIPPEVFYLIIAAFTILIIFTIFSISFYRRI